MSDGVLAEQLDYYRARAGEYDEWWERRGRYDRGTDANKQWFAEISDVRAAFDTLPLDGHVLELAAGTGYWTELLARRAEHVTVLDGAAEMLERNRARLGALANRVEHHQVDLFTWEPEQRYDALVFCFWISHVPAERLLAFMQTCRRALHASATLFFLDGRRVDDSTAVDHVLPSTGDEIALRRLNDGREYRVIKNFHEPDHLLETARAAGFALEVFHTDTYFQFGIGTAI